MKHTLKRLLIVLGALALGAAAYLSLLLSTVDEQSPPKATAQPVEASPALRAQTPEELVRMVNQFPGALLAAKEDAGLTLLGAESHDTAFRGGWARVAEAVYQSGSGHQLRLLSFYPAEAIALLDTDGWLVSPLPGPAVSGCETVRLTRAGETRLTLTYGEGAFCVSIPEGLPEAQAAGPLQLYSKVSEE